MITLNTYDIVNGEHQQIGQITAQSLDVASKKLKFKFPNSWAFLQLIKTGITTTIGGQK